MEHSNQVWKQHKIPFEHTGKPCHWPSGPHVTCGEPIRSNPSLQTTFTVSWGAYCVLSPGFICLFATAGAEQMIFDTKSEGKNNRLWQNHDVWWSITRIHHERATLICRASLFSTNLGLRDLLPYNPLTSNTLLKWLLHYTSSQYFVFWWAWPLETLECYNKTKVNLCDDFNMTKG